MIESSLKDISIDNDLYKTIKEMAYSGNNIMLVNPQEETVVITFHRIIYDIPPEYIWRNDILYIDLDKEKILLKGD
jgi:hypothetical protein